MYLTCSKNLTGSQLSTWIFLVDRGPAIYRNWPNLTQHCVNDTYIIILQSEFCRDVASTDRQVSGHSNYQIGPNRRYPVPNRGYFLALHFFWCWYIENWILTQTVLMLMWTAVHTQTSSEWSTKDLVRVANYSICSLGLTDMLCIATLQLTAIDNDDEVGL